MAGSDSPLNHPLDHPLDNPLDHPLDHPLDNPPENPLDNLVWHALRGPQTHLAASAADGSAVRFQPEVSPFCAAGIMDADGWAGLAELAPLTGYTLLFRDRIGEPPPGWRTMMTEVATQFVAEDLPEPPDLDYVDLDAGDAPVMEALAVLTEPGPFGPRTHETGSYLGIFRDDQLIAMAGERMRCDGWVEVSAVCVHPSARRQGLGAALTLEVARRIRSGGAEAMLHVREGNAGAMTLYETIGFKVRRTIDVGVFVPPSR